MTGYVGLPPFGYAKPLEAARNLADVVDKAAALTNLGAAKSDDVIQSANPIGTIIAYWGSTAPAGYLPCSGQTVSSSIYPQLVAFLGGTTSATLPDLRGEFLRGWDNSRGVDSGRANLSFQADDFKSHTHTFLRANSAAVGQSGSNSAPFVNNSTIDTGAAGGTETRPRNIAVLYCIKAYAAPVSQGTIDMNSLLSLSSTAVQSSQFTGSLNQGISGNGFQRFPGGLLMQWGTYNAPCVDTRTITLPVAYNTGIFFVSHTLPMAVPLLNGYVGRIIPVAANPRTQIALSYDYFTQTANPTVDHQWITIGY